MTGKSRFVWDLIQSPMFDTDIHDIIVCYTEWQSLYEKMKDRCRFHRGLIDSDDLDPSYHNLIILDDLLGSAEDPRVEQLFIRGAHHKNASVILITQNLFAQGKRYRTCALNSSYICVFKSPRSISQIKVLQSQIFPTHKNFLVDSYLEACKQPYRCLFLDMKPDTPDFMRVRGRILDTESQDVYVPQALKLSDIQNDCSFKQ